MWLKIEFFHQVRGYEGISHFQTTLTFLSKIRTKIAHSLIIHITRLFKEWLAYKVKAQEIYIYFPICRLEWGGNSPRYYVKYTKKCKEEGPESSFLKFYASVVIPATAYSCAAAGLAPAAPNF